MFLIFYFLSFPSTSSSFDTPSEKKKRFFLRNSNESYKSIYVLELSCETKIFWKDVLMSSAPVVILTR